jgi:hypothetical protein
MPPDCEVRIGLKQQGSGLSCGFDMARLCVGWRQQPMSPNGAGPLPQTSIYPLNCLIETKRREVRKANPDIRVEINWIEWADPQAMLEGIYKRESIRIVAIPKPNSDQAEELYR